jgi:hypothetical protein
MFCPQCGKEITEGQAFCQHCGAALAAAPGTDTAQAGGRAKTDWEDREHSSFFHGLTATLNKVLFKPTEFFRSMPLTGGLIDPLLFTLITGMIGMIFDYFWRALLSGPMQDFMPAGIAAAAGESSLQGIVGLGILSVILPILIVVGIFISAGILHLSLAMVTGARAGFEATFRVAAYSYSANIFLVLPICGYLIACVWAVVLTVIGLKEVHGISGGKALFAVSLPMLLCCGLIILAMSVVFMGVFAASFGSMMQLGK